MASASSSVTQPKDFWDLIAREQNARPKTRKQKKGFRTLCRSVLSNQPGDRQYWLHKAMQEQCPQVENALKDMGVRISDVEEQIARKLTSRKSNRTTLDKYGKLCVLKEKQIRPLSYWQELVDKAVSLERNYREKLNSNGLDFDEKHPSLDVGKKDPGIDRGSLFKRVGTTFIRFFSSMERAGWNPNQGTPKPLHAAVEGNCPMAAEAMILRRADVNSVENGETPLARASRLGHLDVVRILKKHASSGWSESESKKPEPAPAKPTSSSSNPPAKSASAKPYSPYTPILWVR